MRRPSVLAGALVLSLLTACTIHQRVKTAVRRVPAPAARSVCVLFFDGLSTENFERLLAAGAIPNVKSEIVDRGLVFDTAVASLPSETYPNLATMLTGLLPGHHGIPANVWLDRRVRHREAHTNIFRTFSVSDFLSPDARTLYERLPADTVAVTSPVARGATIHSRNVIAAVASYVRNDWGFLDRKTLDDTGDAYAGAARSGRIPSLVWSHLLGPDEIAHSDGPDSAAFREHMTVIDRAFARLVRRMKRRRLFERTLFVLVGDHGNASFQRAENAEQLVHRALFDHPAAADCAGGDCRLTKVKKGVVDVGTAEISTGAFRGVAVWLPATRPPENVPTAFRTRKGRGRKGRPPTALLRMPPASEFAATLARFPEVGLVLTRGSEAGRIWVYGPEGRAEIVRREFANEPSLYAYTVMEGKDPLGYAGHPRLAEMAGRLWPASAWLERSAPTEHPDLVVQAPEYFESPRSPDVFFSPAEGWGFRFGKAGGHGGLSRREMVVPMVFAGPGVAPGHRPVARTVDLTPTILSYLGLRYDPEELDGDDREIGTAALLSEPVPEPRPDDEADD